MGARCELRREETESGVTWDTYFPPTDVGGLYCAVGLCQVSSTWILPLGRGIRS